MGELKRVTAKKMKSGPNLYCWAVLVDGEVKYSEGLNRSAAQRIVRQIREKSGIKE